MLGVNPRYHKARLKAPIGVPPNSENTLKFVPLSPETPMSYSIRPDELESQNLDHIEPCRKRGDTITQEETQQSVTPEEIFLHEIDSCVELIAGGGDAMCTSYIPTK